MRLSDHYDVICAGSGLSSYLCAALLAKSGKRVLVIDDEDQAMPRVCDGEFVFDPDYVNFSGLDESGALGRSLRELGLIGENGSAFKPIDEITQVLTSNYRIVFWKNATEACNEVRRELKSSSDHVCEFLKMVYEAGDKVSSFVENAYNPGQSSATEIAAWKRYWGRFYEPISRHKPVSMRKVLGDLSGQTCESLVAAILGAVSYSAPMNLGFEQGVRGLSLPFKGLHYYVGGAEVLKERLADIIKQAGGGVKRDAKVESLISESKRITGVLLSSYEGIVRGDTVVLSSRLRRLYMTLPSETRDPSLLRSLSRVQPSSWRFTISVTVNRDVIPIGATSNMAYVGSYQQPLEEENYLRIQVLPQDGTVDSKNSDRATLLVTALVPYRSSSMDYGYLRRLGGRMLRTLAELFPFLEHNIIRIYPDIRSGEQMLREFYPFSGPDWVSENLLQYYVRGQRLVQDFWGPPWTTPHANLYFAGRSIWPALGIYGEALTARKIFEDVMRPGGSSK